MKIKSMKGKFYRSDGREIPKYMLRRMGHSDMNFYRLSEAKKALNKLKKTSERGYVLLYHPDWIKAYDIVQEAKRLRRKR